MDAAVAAGKVHPANRDRWLLRVAQGGTDAAAAVMDLLRLWPADRATRASWQVRASGGPDGTQDDPDGIYARLWPTAAEAAQGRPGPEIDRLAAVDVRQDWLSSHAAGPRTVAADAQDDEEAALWESVYPTNETAAAMLERRTRQQARDAARFTQAQDYSNTMRAAAAGDGDPADPEGGGNPHHEVIDHPPTTVAEHDHVHSSYQGGTHRHPHAHTGDHSHAPEPPNHLHQLAAAAAVTAGIEERIEARAAAGDPYPPGSDEVLYRELFGD